MNLQSEAYAHLEKILLEAEELLALCRIGKEGGPEERDVHREVRERFLMRTKMESVAHSISSIYSILVRLKHMAHEDSYWARAPSISPYKAQKIKNKQALKRLLDSMGE